MKTHLFGKGIAGMLAMLVVGLVRSACGADGFANVNSTTTGGAGGPTVTVTTLADLNANILDDLPRIVRVSGTINLGTSNVRFGSNKTITGVGTGSGFIGNLKAVDESNVIIQNLNFNNPDAVGDGDGLTLQGSTHIFVDHCNFVDCGDGSLDITHGCDFVTVSWCKFSYTFNSGHNFVNLIGHNDNNAGEDQGKLHVTFHHNWWAAGCVERMPRVRYGSVHSYNNYFNCSGNNYCIRASIQSQILSDHNSFENIDEPWNYFSPPGLIRSVADLTVNCTGVIIPPPNDPVFTPPYSYTADAAGNVKAAVMAGAGTGGGGGNISPTVSITAPLAGATFTAPANITVSANAADADGTVTSVAFFANGSPIGTDTTSPYSISWNNVAAASYTLTAVATDNAGAQTTSAGVNIIVNPSGNTPPTVSITAPLAGATFTAPANITVSANAADANGTVTSVAFFANGTAIGTDTTSPYSISWNNVAANSYSLTAVATDNGGAQTTSAAVNITVTGTGGTTVTFTSIAVEDGRILESSEGSNTGGSVDNTGTSSSALRTGDDSSDRQYKTILSFDTSSIPDGATITAATIRMVRGSASGTSPFTTHGSCFVDIRGGTGFNNSAALQTTDFQAAADATQVATMSNAASDGAASTGTLNATGRGLVNKTGKTQLRVYFSLDDNDDASTDYIGWFSGNDATAGNRPTLQVTYQ